MQFLDVAVATCFCRRSDRDDFEFAFIFRLGGIARYLYAWAPAVQSLYRSVLSFAVSIQDLCVFLWWPCMEPPGKRIKVDDGGTLGLLKWHIVASIAHVLRFCEVKVCARSNVHSIQV